MKHFLAILSVLAIVALIFVPGSYAQYSSQNPSLSGQQKQPSKAPAGVNKDEYNAYKAIYDGRADSSKTIQLSSDFIAKYPMSMFLASVYSVLTNAYLRTNQTDKMFDAGGKALALNPDDVDVLSVLAWAIPRGSNAPPDQLQKAQGYARHGIELINAMAKPATLDDATFTKAKNEKLSLCYSGLGTVDYKLGKFEDAVTDLNQAVKLPALPDTVDLYLLGMADENGNHFTAGIAAFTKCAAMQGPMQAYCQSGIDETKKKAQNNIEAP